VAEQTEKIVQALSRRVRCPVRGDDKTLDRYAADQSIYRVRPLAVVFPADLEDVVAVVAFARDRGIPLTPRGGGSTTTGSALGRGIILTFDKAGPLNRILGFEEVEGRPQVALEPGLVHDSLQRFLRERGLYLPSDPSSGPMCLLGGNIATKASGPHALKHGSIDRYLLDVQFVTIAGEVVDTAERESIPARIREGVRVLRDSVLSDELAVRTLRSRQEMKLASGYNLFTFVRHHGVGDWVGQLMVGSVGTLAVITQATLRAEPYVEGRASTVLGFRSLYEAADAVQHIRSLGVAAIEIINQRTIAIVKHRQSELQLPDGEVHALLVEYEGADRYEQITQVERLVRENGYKLVEPIATINGEDEQAGLWKVRKALLPIIRGPRRRWLAPSLVNDVGVDVSHLADFIRDIERVFDDLDLPVAIYGHAGSGNLHLRPLFERSAPDIPALLTCVADRVYEVVFKYEGTITAEHGMGRLRTPYLRREWGDGMMRYMRQIKQIFDPDDLLNPDVMFSERRLTDDLAPAYAQKSRASEGAPAGI
jgi:FAD/FMN-containing dehydrogenase